MTITQKMTLFIEQHFWLALVALPRFHSFNIIQIKWLIIQTMLKQQQRQKESRKTQLLIYIAARRRQQPMNEALCGCWEKEKNDGKEFYAHNKRAKI